MKLRIVLFALALVFGLQTNWAANTPATNNGIEPIVADDYSPSSIAADADISKVVKKDKKGLGKIFSWVKKKVVKLFQNFGLIEGMDDPVDKWFWFWIIGWAGGLVLYIIAVAVGIGTLFSGGFGFAAILALLAYLAWLFGSVSLVVWLIKSLS
jgi:Flp pilus assembly protein TadB